MKIVTTQVADGDRVELPEGAEVNVATQTAGLSASVYLHAVGASDADMVTYAVEVYDGDGEVSSDAEYVATAHVKYERFLTVLLTEAE